MPEFPRILDTGSPVSENALSLPFPPPNLICLKVALDAGCCYTMCMHLNRPNCNSIIATIAEMEDHELEQLQAAIDRRRGTLKKKQSAVIERRDYRNGVLQLEGRAYRRKKDDGLTERGPYWYFHYREGGKQRTLYIGKTDNPEAKVNEIMEGE